MLTLSLRCFGLLVLAGTASALLAGPSGTLLAAPAGGQAPVQATSLGGAALDSARVVALIRTAAEGLRSPEMDPVQRELYAGLRQHAERLGVELPSADSNPEPDRPQYDPRPDVASVLEAEGPEAALRFAAEADTRRGIGGSPAYALALISDRFGRARAFELALREVERPSNAVWAALTGSGGSAPWDPTVLSAIDAASLSDRERRLTRQAALGAMIGGSPPDVWEAVDRADPDEVAHVGSWVLSRADSTSPRGFVEGVAREAVEALREVDPSHWPGLEASLFGSCWRLELSACPAAGLHGRLHPGAFGSRFRPCDRARLYWDHVVEQDRRFAAAGAPTRAVAEFRALALAQATAPFANGACDPRMDSAFVAWMPELDEIERRLPPETADRLRAHIVFAWAPRDAQRGRGAVSRLSSASRDSILVVAVQRAWGVNPLPAIDLWIEFAKTPQPIYRPEDIYSFLHRIGQPDRAAAVLPLLEEGVRLGARLEWASILLGTKQFTAARDEAMAAIAQWTPGRERMYLSRFWTELEEYDAVEALLERLAPTSDATARARAVAAIAEAWLEVHRRRW